MARCVGRGMRRRALSRRRGRRQAENARAPRPRSLGPRRLYILSMDIDAGAGAAPAGSSGAAASSAPPAAGGGGPDAMDDGDAPPPDDEGLGAILDELARDEEAAYKARDEL